jgi:hypothetical protein
MRTGLKVLTVGALLLATVPVTYAEEVTYTGEVLDLACYIAKGAQGADHAGCAKSCVKGGQPMGLLTEDGTVLVLAANHDDGAPYEAVKDWAGQSVEVTGELSERDGMKVVSVTGSKAAG